jgi:hypothetical protein
MKVISFSFVWFFMSSSSSSDPRSLWLSSPDALLQVLCVVAMNGHDARNFSSLTTAFRGDEVLWGCIKEGLCSWRAQ